MYEVAKGQRISYTVAGVLAALPTLTLRVASGATPAGPALALDRAVAGPAGVCVLIAGAAYAVAGFAADKHRNAHVVLVALPLFVLGNVGLVLAAARRSAWSSTLRWAALLMGLVGLAATGQFFSGNLRT